MTGPDHHAEMEAHYATGRDRQDLEHADEIIADLRAEVQEAVQALYAFTKIRWWANTEKKSDDVYRAILFIKKHDPEGWASQKRETL